MNYTAVPRILHEYVHTHLNILLYTVSYQVYVCSAECRKCSCRYILTFRMQTPSTSTPNMCVSRKSRGESQQYVLLYGSQRACHAISQRYHGRDSYNNRGRYISVGQSVRVFVAECQALIVPIPTTSELLQVSCPHEHTVNHGSTAKARGCDSMLLSRSSIARSKSRAAASAAD